MKFVAGLTLAVLMTLLRAEAAPGELDTGKRAVEVSTDDKAVLPDTKPLERNEVVAEKRFNTDRVEKKSAIVGERRSGITVGETREKTLFQTPERKQYEVIERQESVLNGKHSRFSTSEDAYRTQVATRFQDKIGEATPFAGDMTPVVSKRTTFDRVNRFSFRRNGGQNDVSVTTAGSEQAPRSIADSSAPGTVRSESKDAPPATGPVAPSAR